jgi:hypothetical protein
MGHNYIRTEHILLALAEFENGTGLLADLGIDKAAAEAHITAQNRDRRHPQNHRHPARYPRRRVGRPWGVIPRPDLGPTGG